MGKGNPSFSEEREAGSSFGFWYFYPLHPKQKENIELMCSYLPFPAAPAFLLPSCQILPFSIYISSCFRKLPAPKSGFCALYFKSTGSGNAVHKFRMVTGNLLIAMETWACYKLFHFALGHMFGTCWLGAARSPLALGLSNARQLILLPAPKWTGNSESFIPEQ